MKDIRVAVLSIVILIFLITLGVIEYATGIRFSLFLSFAISAIALILVVTCISYAIITVYDDFFKK